MVRDIDYRQLWEVLTVIECRACWFKNFWVDFNTFTVNGSFNLDKYEQEIRKRGGIFEPGGDSERGGAV